MTDRQADFHGEEVSSVKMKSATSRDAEDFDLLAGGPPRGDGFVQIGDVARPMVRRLAEHLIECGVISRSLLKDI